MDNLKDDKFYAIKSIEDIDVIEKYIANKSYFNFVNNNLLIDAVMFILIQLGENIKNISDDFKNNHLDIL